ncbi:hypothetical protein LOC72_13485 [Roseiconus lacunae]|nr:hypothetical protein [Roseiconus lacunae]
MEAGHAGSDSVVNSKGRRMKRGRLVRSKAWGILLASLIAVFGMVPKQLPAAGFQLPNMDAENLPTASLFDVPSDVRLGPLLGFEFGGISLQRSADDPFPMVYDDGLTQVLATSDFLDPEMESGFRYSIQLFNLCEHVVPGLDTELTYYEVGGEVAYEILDASTLPTTNIVPVFFKTIPATPEPSEEFSLRSNLDSVEWNLGYRPIAGLKLIGGVRWLGVKEHFNHLGGISGDGFFSQSDNEYTGGQIGLEGTIWTNGVFRFFGCGKYAFLNNDVRGFSTMRNTSITFDDDIDSNLVDLEFGVSGAIGRHWTIQVAYQGLILDDVAAILPQSNTLDAFGTNDQTPVYSDVSWHGLHYGITFTY